MQTGPGDTKMLYSPEGKSFKGTVIETREWLESRKLIRLVTVEAKGKNAVKLQFHEDIHGNCTGLPDGWGMSYDAPLPADIRVGCECVFVNTSSNSGAEAYYKVKVLGMTRDNSESDPYYSGVFLCEVLKTKPYRSGYQSPHFKPLRVGAKITLSVSSLQRVVKAGEGLPLIPYRICLTAKEERKLRGSGHVQYFMPEMWGEYWENQKDF